MKNGMPDNPQKQEKVLEPLAHALAAGFTDTARHALHDTASVTFIKMESISLRTLLASASAMSGMEICFDAGVTGRALLMIAASDLARLGGKLSGLESPGEGPATPEVMEAGLRFFAGAMDAAGKSFAQSYGLALHANAPTLFNAEGTSEALLSAADAYSSVHCLVFQLRSTSGVDCRILFLVHADLLGSLQAQLPQYAKAMSREASGRKSSSRENVDLSAASPQSNWNMDLILDVELEVAVSFGETQMPLRDILKLGIGSVIELEKAVNDPVAILVNNKPIAHGEVVMVDGNYGVKVLEVESTADRIRSLG